MPTPIIPRGASAAPEVLTLEEAVRRYPDCRLGLTYRVSSHRGAGPTRGVPAGKAKAKLEAKLYATVAELRRRAPGRLRFIHHGNVERGRTDVRRDRQDEFVSECRRRDCLPTYPCPDRIARGLTREWLAEHFAGIPAVVVLYDGPERGKGGTGTRGLAIAEGMARAKARGKRVGRPRACDGEEAAVVAFLRPRIDPRTEQLDFGTPLREAAAVFGRPGRDADGNLKVKPLGPATVERILDRPLPEGGKTWREWAHERALDRHMRATTAR
jgi:hypothetical protein